MSRKKLTIEEMQQIAAGHEGKCLSKEYDSCRTKLKWQCKEGHIWKSSPTNVKNGSWCPVCSRNAKLTIEQMKQIAKERGGKCLSKEYKNLNTKLKWQCKEGHIWKATPKSVRHMSAWCPICAREKHIQTEIKTIKELQKMAKKRNGQCLSKRFIDSDTELEWQCKEGHIWKATPKSVQQGSWCPACWKEMNEKFAKQYAAEIKMIAKKQGGKCLQQYAGANTKIKWQCKEGHIWQSIPRAVKNGHWCPICRQNKRESLSLSDA